MAVAAPVASSFSSVLKSILKGKVWPVKKKVGGNEKVNYSFDETLLKKVQILTAHRDSSVVLGGNRIENSSAKSRRRCGLGAQRNGLTIHIFYYLARFFLMKTAL